VARADSAVLSQPNSSLHPVELRYSRGKVGQRPKRIQRVYLISLVLDICHATLLPSRLEVAHCSAAAVHSKACDTCNVRAAAEAGRREVSMGNPVSNAGIDFGVPGRP
jgi:hypothetical protein